MVFIKANLIAPQVRPPRLDGGKERTNGLQTTTSKRIRNMLDIAIYTTEAKRWYHNICNARPQYRDAINLIKFDKTSKLSKADERVISNRVQKTAIKQKTHRLMVFNLETAIEQTRSKLDSEEREVLNRLQHNDASSIYYNQSDLQKVSESRGLMSLMELILTRQQQCENVESEGEVLSSWLGTRYKIMNVKAAKLAIGLKKPSQVLLFSPMPCKEDYGSLTLCAENVTDALQNPISVSESMASGNVAPETPLEEPIQPSPPSTPRESIVISQPARPKTEMDLEPKVVDHQRQCIKHHLTQQYQTREPMTSPTYLPFIEQRERPLFDSALFSPHRSRLEDLAVVPSLSHPAPSLATAGQKSLKGILKRSDQGSEIRKSVTFDSEVGAYSELNPKLRYVKRYSAPLQDLPQSYLSYNINDLDSTTASSQSTTRSDPMQRRGVISSWGDGLVSKLQTFSASCSTIPTGNTKK